jgi:PTS system N-acetylgalactosamine-specific IIA component
MIGIILLGHNKFGSGLKSSMELIVGEQDYVSAIDFLPEYGTEILDKRISEELVKLENCSEIIIFTDLMGGSPFNRAMTAFISSHKNNIHVISGSNLPMVIEAIMSRDGNKDIQSFISNIMNTGKDGIKYGNDILKENL